MKTPGILCATAVLCFAAAFAQSAGSRAEKNEARLAEMLQERVAGEPVSCIVTNRSNKLQVIEEVALVYDAGDVVYVARPTDPEVLGRDDVVVINRFGGQLCNTDIIRTVDRTGGFHTGVLFLEKWIPYRKSK